MNDNFMIVKIKDMTIPGNFISDSVFQSVTGINFDIDFNNVEFEIVGELATKHIIELTKSLDRLANYWT